MRGLRRRGEKGPRRRMGLAVNAPRAETGTGEDRPLAVI